MFVDVHSFLMMKMMSNGVGYYMLSLLFEFLQFIDSLQDGLENECSFFDIIIFSPFLYQAISDVQWLHQICRHKKTEHEKQL